MPTSKTLFEDNFWFYPPLPPSTPSPLNFPSFPCNHTEKAAEPNLKQCPQVCIAMTLISLHAQQMLLICTLRHSTSVGSCKWLKFSLITQALMNVIVKSMAAASGEPRQGLAFACPRWNQVEGSRMTAPRIERGKKIWMPMEHIQLSICTDKHHSDRLMPGNCYTPSLVRLPL